MDWPYVPRSQYHRRTAIHARYGGQERSGITTPARVPGIFLFTGHGAEKVGYGDSWLPDGTLRYTGEGQVGDMEMVRGNRAVRDHSAGGKDLLVFEQLRQRGFVRFIDRFVCAGWETEQQPDRNERLRKAIVFLLVPAERAEPDLAVEDNAIRLDIGELRRLAYDAVTPESGPKAAAASVYARAAAVRTYVLARAGGVCEACHEPAPFTTAGGRPYLEPHHIRRLSDGGPDHPAFVAGVCPNCHRRAHHGSDGRDFNSALLTATQTKEAALRAAS